MSNIMNDIVYRVHLETCAQELPLEKNITNIDSSMRFIMANWNMLCLIMCNSDHVGGEVSVTKAWFSRTHRFVTPDCKYLTIIGCERFKFRNPNPFKNESLNCTQLVWMWLWAWIHLPVFPGNQSLLEYY